MTDEHGSRSRHRRRREPGDPHTTGSIPVVRSGSDYSEFLEVRYGGPGEQGYPIETRHAAPEPELNIDPAFVDRPVTRPTPPVQPNPPASRVPAAPQAPIAQTPIAHNPAAQTPTDPLQRPSAGAFDILDDGVADSRADAAAAVDPASAGPPSAPEDDALGMPERRGRKKALLAVLAIGAVLVLIAGIGLSRLGAFDSRKDFDSATGGSPVLVEIPENTSLRDFGTILTDAGVVGSQKAFVDAANGRALPAGFYLLPTGVSGASAVAMMAGEENRIGRLVIPEGLQLDSKKGIDGKTTPGIFEMLKEATAVSAGDVRYGVTVEDLQHAAATASADELGIPEWARVAVRKLDGDHRRIEGLIASGAWEDVDPRMSATELLRSLITRSATRFESWGLLQANDSGLLPYDTLVVASIVEREVSQDQDYPKVARVILNRLDKGQKLEMDSTANYTAEVTNIDVHGEAYTSKTEWNTYQKEGLPITPIGAVGQKALQAVEQPADGNWLYFVTVDKNGTTLFANTFERHKKNRQIACRNKFVTTGC